MPERRHKMSIRLSHKLIDLGFFSALGTSEHAGVTGKEVHVKRGNPYTYDSNNGVTVVYDEDGRPWIIQSNLGFSQIVAESLQNAVEELELKRGAYVPHSNDGGQFVRVVIPSL